jgi:P-type Cu+ transporter
MTVDIATAKYMSTVEGTLFYFCAASCKATFDRDPLSFAERPD